MNACVPKVFGYSDLSTAFLTSFPLPNTTLAVAALPWPNPHSLSTAQAVRNFVQAVLQSERVDELTAPNVCIFPQSEKYSDNSADSHCLTVSQLPRKQATNSPI